MPTHMNHERWHMIFGNLVCVSAMLELTFPYSAAAPRVCIGAAVQQGLTLIFQHYTGAALARAAQSAYKTGF